MGTFKDLTGQRFGKITVVKLDEELSKQKKRKYWICQCDCGRIKSIRGDGLKNIKSCGNCENDLTNQRFGRLIALEKGKKDKAQHQYWICKCDCGNIVEVNGDNLRRGLTQSCGCLHSEIIHNLKFEDLRGQKFGLLTPINYQIRDQRAFWTCKCDCGNITEVQASNLKSGHTQSCGCTRSIGEYNISQLLLKNNIPFIHDKTYFKDLIINKGVGRYDFILYPDTDTIRLIEFDGLQHFTSKTNAIWNTEENLEKVQTSDKIKNEYALSHNIPLVRIPYTERDNITLDMILGDKYLVKEVE